MKTKDKSKQYVIYSRKSKFTGKGESIENQIELCRQYIAMHFGDDAAENALVYEDEGFSGGNLERPQFKKMMKDSQKIAFAAIVVYRLDRISRNIGDFAKLIEDLGDRHIDFISIREQFDTSSPMGRAMMYIASVFSQLERETIAERIRDNMHELSKTGRWLGGTTPTGYASESESKITVDGKERKAYKLKPIPEGNPAGQDDFLRVHGDRLPQQDRPVPVGAPLCHEARQAVHPLCHPWHSHESRLYDRRRDGVSVSERK